MRLTRFNYVRSMAFQSTSKFLPGLRLVFRSLLFIVDKMGDLSLQEPESRVVTGSYTNHILLILAQVGLTCKAQLRNGSSIMGESELDPSGDNANHHEICCPTTAYPIYKPSPESISDRGREVFMVGPGHQPPPLVDQTVEEIAQEPEEKIIRLAREAGEAAGKRH
jgi:hypothetical protein